jgi:hypothetical protein
LAESRVGLCVGAVAERHKFVALGRLVIFFGGVQRNASFTMKANASV